MNWISVKDRLPDDGVIVQVLQSKRRVVTNLERHGNIWFSPDGSMYVYHTPTHWMPLSESLEPN